MIITDYNKHGSNISFQVKVKDDAVTDIEIPLYYYLTYTAQMNGEQLELEQGNDGMIRLKNISQEGEIRVWFPECPLWLATDLISACTVLASLFVGVKKHMLLVDHHSVFRTLMVGMFMRVGRIIFNSDNIGILLYTILQMVFTAWVLAHALYKLNGYGVSGRIFLSISMDTEICCYHHEGYAVC